MKLIVDDLCVMRGEDLVLDNLSLIVNAGDAVAITGANGAGKTTLLKTVAGLISPLSGRVFLENGGLVKTQCHYIGHNNALKPSLTVRENLEFWQSVPGGERQAIAPALAKLGVELLIEAVCGDLSAGQKRRVALARLLCVRRPIWLLDEPEIGLDAASRNRLEALLAEHRKSGGIALVASHYPLTLEGAKALHMGETS